MSNIDINGYKFNAEDLKAEESQDTHEFNRTKIMNGTEILTVGAYVPMEWKFTTHKTVLKEYSKYNKMIRELDDHIVKVNCPEIGNSFNALCKIKRTPLNKWIELEFRLIRVRNTHNYVIKNGMYDNPFVSIYSARKSIKLSSGSKSQNNRSNKKPETRFNKPKGIKINDYRYHDRSIIKKKGA